MLDQYSQTSKTVPLRVKQRIHAVNIFDTDSVMRFSITITSVANILKNIYISVTVLNEFTSKYDDDENDTFNFVSTIYS